MCVCVFSFYSRLSPGRETKKERGRKAKKRKEREPPVCKSSPVLGKKTQMNVNNGRWNLKLNKSEGSS